MKIQKAIPLLLLAFLAILGGASPASGASPTIRRIYNYQAQRWEMETVPGLIPATTTDVTTADAHIVEIHLSASAATTCQIRDKQAAPVPVSPDDQTIAAKTEYVKEFTGRLAPGGITWSCADGTAVVGFIRWY